MEILNVKVERQTKEKIERLVKSKGFKNKSEAVRTIIEEHLAEHPELFAETELGNILAEADKMSDEDFDKLAEEVFQGSKKSAAELVSEERERMQYSVKQFYMDTNVFLSRFKPDDPYYVEAKSIVKDLEQGVSQAETSVLTLLEVASVSGRAYESIERTQDETQADHDRKKKVFVVRILRRLARLKTRFVNIAGDTPISLRGIEAELPSVFNEAILLSLQCNLRTLDLVHLAAARHAKRMNSELEAFVTGDKGFLSNKKKLSSIIGMPILSPKEYVEAYRT